jgi:hypothetical protein
VSRNIFSLCPGTFSGKCESTMGGKMLVEKRRKLSV